MKREFIHLQMLHRISHLSYLLHVPFVTSAAAEGKNHTEKRRVNIGICDSMKPRPGSGGDGCWHEGCITILAVGQTQSPNSRNLR